MRVVDKKFNERVNSLNGRHYLRQLLSINVSQRLSIV